MLVSLLYTNLQINGGKLKNFFLSSIYIMYIFAFLTSCTKIPEMTLEEIELAKLSIKNDLISKTISKPWKGETYKAGKVNGIWQSSMTADPKSFNLLIAERDGTTASILSHMHDYLVNYDYVKKEFVPQCATPKVFIDEKNKTMTVTYTLRENLFWSFYNSNEKIPVTSDDVIFWYDEIEGDPEFHSSAYNSQFVEMDDGSNERITIKKIDDKTFAFHFPRLDSNPLLSTNRNFGPKFLYAEAKKNGGTKAVKDLLSVATDVKKIPSMGMWFLTEYSPGQRLVFTRNPDYWKRDEYGNAFPYPEQKIVQIVSDQNTQFLLFKDGRQETYAPRPEDIDELVNDANNFDRVLISDDKTKGWSVFNSQGSLSAPLWSFNQNPKNINEKYYHWFIQKEFRQAMSCLLNRQRIIQQAYRGLAEPKYSFFAEANPFFKEEISLQYRYNPEQAKILLEKIGIKPNTEGTMIDSDGNKIEFDLTITSDSNVYSDIASIIADECAKIGINVRIRNIDFQKIVEQLSATYDWQSVIIGLGSNYWPTQGSNVWPSTGNLHLWYPLQKKPATEWEARIDFLYNEGSYTIDTNVAEKIWDEYQKIILEQCPIIYLVRSKSFFAMNNRWNFENFYFDNIGGAVTDFVYLNDMF